MERIGHNRCPPLTGLLSVAVLGALVLLTSCLESREPKPYPATDQSQPADGDTGQASEIIIDNTQGAPEFVAEPEDGWESCSRADCGEGCWGEDFLYAVPGCLHCRAEFRPHLPSAGEYEVSIWWPRGDDRSTAAPVEVHYREGGVHGETLNLQLGSGWYKLGIFAFDEGSSGYVEVRGAADGFTNADAVRFIRLGD